MTNRRDQIVSAFTSLKILLCDTGMFVEGNSRNGIFVKYWANRNLRQLTTFRGGVADGFEVRRFGPANPPHFRHLKGGRPYGESMSVFRSGQGIEHVLIDGDLKIDYTEEEAERFKGYLTTNCEENMYQKYAKSPGRIDLLN